MRVFRITTIPCATAALVAVLAPLAMAAFQVPAYQGYVTDNANVLSPETEARIAQIDQELKAKTTAEIAVLTVETLDGTPVETAALETFRQWGVGDKQSNTGLLLLIAVNDRKMRTEVGYGLEGVITDGTTGEVSDRYLIPAFRAQNYDAGVLAATMAYARLIANEKNVNLASLTTENAGEQGPESLPSRGSGELPTIVRVLFVLFLLFLFTRRGGPRGGIYYGGGFGGGFGGGGFSGGGFGGGGFGGFGGGSSGGGGSSRGW